MIEDAYQAEVKRKDDLLKRGLAFVPYIGYRELRLSGFVLKPVKDIKGEGAYVKLECGAKPRIRMKLKGIWRKPFFYTWEEKASKLYSKYWLGQHLSYKRKQGTGTFFDEYESYYLYLKHAIEEKVPEPPHFGYYQEWRDCGYVVKTGFKFGALFRIYLPGTTPDQRIHSQYLLRVLEKKRFKGLEFFSVLRIAESVKKRLIIPVELPSQERSPHYALYKEGFLGYIAFLYEGENIFLPGLLRMFRYALNRNAPLFLGVVDRDTSLTLFKLTLLKLKRDYLLIQRVKY